MDGRRFEFPRRVSNKKLCQRMLVALNVIVWTAAGAASYQSSDHPTESAGFDFGMPLDGLSEEEQDAFRRGQLMFARVWSFNEGLGPTFNSRDCLFCHRSPATGGGGRQNPSTSVLVIPDKDDLSGFTTFRRFMFTSDKDVIRLPDPDDAERRKAPPLFGLGIIDAIPEATILAKADPYDKDEDGISGRAIELENGIGRISWKGTFASARDFVESAFHGEMGLEVGGFTPIVSGQISEDKLTEEDIDDLSLFLTYLSPPPRQAMTEAAVKGTRCV